MRHAGCDVERLLAAGSDRRCRGAGRPVRGRIDCRGHAARADESCAQRGAPRKGHRPRTRILVGALGGPNAGALSGGRRQPAEDGADSRLADWHARRRTRARGFVRAASRRRHLHVVPRPRLGVAGNRATSHRDVVRAAAAARGDVLSAVPSALSFRDRAVRPGSVRARDQLQPLCREGGRASWPGAAHLLLPLADAVCVGSIRCVLRSGARRTLREPVGVSAPDGAAGAVGCGDDRTRRSVRRQLGARCGTDPPIL